MAQNVDSYCMGITPRLGFPQMSDVCIPIAYASILPTPLGVDLAEPSILRLSEKKFKSPYDWSRRRKNFVLGTASTATCFASFAASSYAPCREQLEKYWNVGSVPILVGIATFTTGFGLGPMFLAPISEVKGRKPTFTVTGLLLISCQICCAVTRSFPGMLVARFWAGVGASTYSTLVGGVIADIYRSHERNTPMAIFSGCALFGTGLGPLICGFVAQNTTWRWVFWLQVIVNSILVALFIMFIPETHETVLLRQKKQYFNDWCSKMEKLGAKGFRLSQTGDTSSTVQIGHVRWKVEGEESTASFYTMITTSLFRPFQMLFTEPVVFFFSLWAAFSWSILYLTLAAVPLIFQSVYGFSLSHADATFASPCIASIIATFVSIYQESWLQGRSAMHIRPVFQNPERRLYFARFESVLLPLGLFVFGWSSRDSVHWTVPTIFIGVATAGIFFVYLAVFNYFADTYHTYASSAIAAQSFCRNVLGGVFPLVTTQMYTRLGYGPGSSLLGAIGLVLSLGPWILWLYGEQIRSRSRFASKLAVTTDSDD